MPSPNRESAPAPSYALRVWRVEPGTAWYLRTLSQALGGLLTHWGKGKSVYCHGEPCPSPYHKVGSVWKGYCSAELWDAARRQWCPIVWEVTETAEVDMRGTFGRGQVWYVNREEDTDKKKKPVRAKLHERLDPATLRDAPDFVPVLRSLYHVPTLTANIRNPMPDRVMVEPCPGVAPAGLDALPVIEVGDRRKTREIEEELRRRGLVNGNGHAPNGK